MGLHAILQVIRDSGQAKIQELESHAYAQAREIIANARMEAEAIREQACEASAGPAHRERARLLQKARLEALHITGEVREALVDAALEQCHGHLAGLRAEPGYPEVLRRLICETLAELESSWESGSRQNASLEADPRDQVILEKLLVEMGLNLEVSYSLVSWGGLVAKNEDGRVAVINTLESRLERATPFLRRYLAALFEHPDREIKEIQVLERNVAV